MRLQRHHENGGALWQSPALSLTQPEAKILFAVVSNKSVSVIVGTSCSYAKNVINHMPEPMKKFEEASLHSVGMLHRNSGKDGTYPSVDFQRVVN